MIIIGEKLTVPSVAKAIAEKNADWIESCKKQTDAGADFIDICASVDEDIEVEHCIGLLIWCSYIFPIALDVRADSISGNSVLQQAGSYQLCIR